jgi:hypothetical protein
VLTRVAPKQLVERKPVAAAVMDDLHLERLRAAGDLGADPSQSDEAECRSREVVPKPFRP